MPRKRRVVKVRRLPDTLAAISGMERAQWQFSGPSIASGGEPVEGYVSWPSWEAWAAFYGAIRDELYRERPWRQARSCADTLYVAYTGGKDVEAVRAKLAAQRRRNDPRRLVMPWLESGGS
jgi:hypothetical protein